EMAHRAVREANTALRGLNEFLEEQTRRISHELHDEAGQLLASVHLALDDVGLMPALDLLAQGVSTRTGLWVKIEGPRDNRFPSPIETVLYRIVQEALNNVHKHAHASAVTIVVRREARRVSCSVRDDGVGFDPGTARSTVKGI